MTIQFTRPQRLAQDIVVIDGMAHSGKQLIGEVIATFKRGELWHFSPVYENLCVAEHFGKVSVDMAGSLINLYADMDLYNLMIGRYVNFRKPDESSVDTNLVAERYRRRLSQPDGDRVVEEILRKKPIFYLMTHSVFGTSDLFFQAFQERLKLFAVAVRHPLWLVDMWYRKGWHHRIGRELREFHLCAKSQGKCVPWFAGDWANEYCRLRPLDQAISVVAFFLDAIDRQLKTLSPQNRKKVYQVPFEHYIQDPWPFLRSMMKALKTRETPLTHQILKKLNFPRPFPKNAIERQRVDMEKLMKKEKVLPSSRKLLERLSSNYEKRYSLTS